MSKAEVAQKTGQLSGEVIQFIDQVRRDVEKVSRVLWESRTLSASQTFQVYQRVPNEEIWISAGYPSLWDDGEVKITVGGFDGTQYLGKVPPGPGRYTKIFKAHPRVTTVIHAH